VFDDLVEIYYGNDHRMHPRMLRICSPAFNLKMKVPEFAKVGLRQAIQIVMFCAIGWLLQVPLSGSKYFSNIQLFCTWQDPWTAGECNEQPALLSLSTMSTICACRRSIIVAILTSTPQIGKTAETMLFLMIGCLIGRHEALVWQDFIID